MDVEQIVDTLSQHKLVRTSRVMDEWYSVYCPFHNNGNEKKASCGVSLHDIVRGGRAYHAGTWHCFSCGASYSMEHGVTEILQLHGIKQNGHDWLVANVQGYEVESDFEYLIPQETMQTLSNKYSIDYIQSMTEEKPTYVSEEELASYRFIVPYMYERKLTDAIIEAYDIGYDANWIPPGRKKPVPCITIPVRDRDGRTLFFCRRSIKGKVFHYPSGSKKPVFGLDMIKPNTKSVVICESALDALTAVSYGYPAVALLGTGDSYQIQQLKELGVSDFVLALDGDEAGRRGAEKLKKHLKSVALVWTIHMPDGTDLNDCTKEEFDSLYMNRD